MLRLALLSLVLSASPAAADCAFSGLTPKPMTATNKSLPLDGGIVIAAVSDQAGKIDPGDAALEHPFKFEGGRTVSLAPGLAVIRVTKPGSLVDAANKTVLAIKLTPKPLLPLPAPEVKLVEHEGRRGRRGNERVLATLENPSSGLIAVVLANAKGSPKSWGLVSGQPVRVVAFSTGDCMSLPNGTQPSKAGDTVTVRYVDGYGRLSPPSKPIKIVESTVAP